MTNRILESKANRQVPTNNVPDEVETSFSRQTDALESSAADPNRTRIATSGNAYPQLPETSPWSVPPDHGFHPDRDRIDPNDECSMTFGIALGGESIPPAEDSSLPSPNSGEIAAEDLPNPTRAISPTLSKEPQS